jgi:lipopolysaccharide transport system ATP-binding protein
MDEWLSAGDDRFLEKARKRMSNLIGGSNIMVLASHSMPLLREWCNRGMFLEQGRVVVNGTIDEAIAAYQTSSDARQMASRRR